MSLLETKPGALVLFASTSLDDVARAVERRVPFDRVRELRVRETDPVGSAIAVGAVYAAIGLLGWLAVVIDPF